MTSAQALANLPITGRSYQSLLTLTPGVAQPSYFQTGGINNPSRSMQVSVNGQPATNTAFRLDGMSVTNQWIPGLQIRPGIEAIETVNIVTSNFEADQGMAGGAAVNVQVKSGTNARHGSAFGTSSMRSSAREITSCRAPARSRREQKTSTAARLAGQSSGISFSTFSVSRRTMRGWWAGPSSGPPRCCCRCLRPSSGLETLPPQARRFTTRAPAPRTEQGEFHLPSPTVRG